jgi:DNA-binding Xre family transcriptional regulator
MDMRTKTKNQTDRQPDPINLDAIKALKGDRTIKEMSASGGLSQALLSMIMSGKYPNPTASTLKRLCQTLDCSSSEILTF